MFRSMASACLTLTTEEKRKAFPCWPRKFCRRHVSADRPNALHLAGVRHTLLMISSKSARCVLQVLQPKILFEFRYTLYASPISTSTTDVCRRAFLNISPASDASRSKLRRVAGWSGLASGRYMLKPYKSRWVSVVLVMCSAAHEIGLFVQP